MLVNIMKLYKRNILNLFREYTENFKVVLITGARQVGKTTFLKSIKEKNRKYVTLDNLDLRFYANNDPEGFLKDFCPPVIIDEIQYAPNLLSYIKIYCDETNERNLFWVTGSQKIQIMKNVSETLVGRMGVLEMHSLTNREIETKDFLPLDINQLIVGKYYSKDDIIKKMYNGSMPDVVYNGVNRDFFYSSYINLYIERDIKELKEIQDLETFRTFMGLVASRAGQLINYSDIAKEAKISDKTVKSWISILENTGIVTFIYQYKKDEYKQLKTHPKLIFMDTGLAISLLRITSLNALINYTYLGNLFENFIISDLIKTNNNFNLHYEFSFYRDKNGNEVDLIITDENNQIHLFEIKMTDKVDERMVKGFKALSDVKNQGKGGIICTSKNLESLNNDIDIIPVGSIIE